MDKVNFYIKEIIGKRCNRDIYDNHGVLIMAASTVITYDHVMLLEECGTSIRHEDVTDISTYDGSDFEEHHKKIDETVTQVSGIFGCIRKTRKIPLADLQKSVIPMIHAVSDSTHLLHLFSALQAKDDYTYRHNIAVGALSNLLGKWMGLNQHDLLQLTTAALLHDVGKMLIPENILNKPGRFTAEEYLIMKKHTTYGYEILKKTIGITHRQALVALQHHERLDGSGYPLGIKDHQIDLFSRIVAVADVFHAMTSNRVYQNQSPFYKALFQMEKDMFGALDPEVTLLFIEKNDEQFNWILGHSQRWKKGDDSYGRQK